MLTKSNKTYSISSSPVRFMLFLLLTVVLALSVNAQNNGKKDSPVWNYKGITLGMTEAQVREKLGSAKSEDAQGLFYIISETETAQFLFDVNKKVKTISVVFAAGHLTPPKFDDVFGKALAADPREDGSIYKMVRFEDTRYWISYSRMAGDNAMVIVTTSKY